MGERKTFPTRPGYAAGEVAAGEINAESAHDGGGAFVVESHFVQFDQETFFAIAGVWQDFRQAHVSRDGGEGDAPVRREQPLPKLDRGYVPFTGGAEAHDKA